LGEAGTRLWTDILNEYRIEDRGSLEVLALAAETLDRVERLRVLIDRDGEVVRDSRGAPKAHPSVKDELQGRALIARLLEKLGLCYEPVKPVGRPPKW
jgi:hypothetical protein